MNTRVKQYMWLKGVESKSQEKGNKEQNIIFLNRIREFPADSN